MSDLRCVYLTQVENNITEKYPKNYYKIGRSNCKIENRLRSLNCSNLHSVYTKDVSNRLPHTLIRTWNYYHNSIVESCTHIKLKQYRLYGEYFNAPLELINETVDNMISYIEDWKLKNPKNWPKCENIKLELFNNGKRIPKHNSYTRLTLEQ